MRKTFLSSTILACLLVAGLAQAAVASDDFVGTAAIADIGFGARPMGMGGAFVSIADDASCVYYNPAGLALQGTRNVISFYSNQHSQAGYFGLAYAQKGIGAGVLNLGSSGIQGTDEYAQPTDTLSYEERVLLASVARTYQRLHVGATLKYYTQTLADEHGSGVTCDLGAMYRGPQYSIGAVARNIFGEVRYSDGVQDPFDRSFVVGVSTTVVPNLTLAFDYETNGTAHVGGEYILSMFALRAGAALREGQSWLTAGLGVKSGVFRFDYAYQTHETLDDTHRLSVTVNF
ncbi:MAG: PorV/PorQ family protein [Bacillota bacterium]|nr:PorV/PorQ family protein [Bacillota bacterium]